MTAKLLRLEAKMTAVDYSDKRMKMARDKFGTGRVRFVTANLARKLLFPSKSFDLATAYLLLEHLRDKKGFL